MKQDFNSIHAKLYRWFWIKDKMPENLCPYARRSIGMYLLILPYVLLSIPVILIESFIKDNSDKLEKMHQRPIIGVILYFMLFMLYCAGYTLIFIWTANSPLSDSNPHKIEFTIGVIIWFFTIFIPSYYGIKLLIQNIKEKRYEKQFKELPEKPDNWLVSFYKAHHDKICPKIDWLNSPPIEDKDKDY